MINDWIGNISSGSNLFVVFSICLAIICLWLVVLTVLAVKSYRFSKKLFGDTGRDTLKDILQEHLGRVGAVQMHLRELEKNVGILQNKALRHLAKVGVVRFNPFDDTGGNQSFVLALLDENSDGVVISSLHGRDRTRVYAKPVKAGKPIDYDFSEEEKQAIQQAHMLGK